MEYPAFITIALDAFAIIGTSATLWGLWKTYGELAQVKKETIQKIDEVRVTTQQQIQDTLNLVNVVKLIKLIEQIQEALKQKQWEIAHFRYSLLSDSLLPLAEKIDRSVVRKDFAISIASIPVNCDTLYNKCLDGRTAIYPKNMNTDLSALKDNLTLLESHLKQKEYGKSR